MIKQTYIDTNVFLRFLVFDMINPKLSKKAKQIIILIKNNKIIAHTNICVVSELVYVLSGYYELTREETINKIIPLLNLENLRIENKPLVISTLYSYKNSRVDFEDSYTHELMKQQNILNIYTFDKKHFKRFKDIKIPDVKILD